MAGEDLVRDLRTRLDVLDNRTFDLARLVAGHDQILRAMQEELAAMRQVAEETHDLMSAHQEQIARHEEILSRHDAAYQAVNRWVWRIVAAIALATMVASGVLAPAVAHLLSGGGL